MPQEGGENFNVILIFKNDNGGSPTETPCKTSKEKLEENGWHKPLRKVGIFENFHIPFIATMRLEIQSNLQDLGESVFKLNQAPYEKMVLNLQNVPFIDSFNLTRWRCLIDHFLRKRIGVSVIPPKREKAVHYAGRMGLFEGTDYIYPYQQQEPMTFFPLICIENDRNDRLFEECLRVFSYSGASSNYVVRFSEAFIELADNIYYHAGITPNSGWGYVHAQVYQKGIAFWKEGYIRIALSDVGIGFYGSYERVKQLRNRTEKEILLDAFKLGESSLNPYPKGGYRGIGLSEVFEFVKKINGSLSLYSGRTRVIAEPSGLQAFDLSFKVAGTWIELKVPLL